jgi:hypothetical protein
MKKPAAQTSTHRRVEGETVKRKPVMAKVRPAINPATFATPPSPPSLAPQPMPASVVEPAPCPMPGGSNNPPERQASLVKRAVVPATMATALGLDGEIGAAGYRLFLDGLIRDAGSPTDPVEIMLLEQMALCHLRSMQLQGQAGEAKGLEAIELYNSAAARLTAEFRKTALALKEYRSK